MEQLNNELTAQTFTEFFTKNFIGNKVTVNYRLRKRNDVIYSSHIFTNFSVIYHKTEHRYFMEDYKKIGTDFCTLYLNDINSYYTTHNGIVFQTDEMDISIHLHNK